MRDEFKFEPWLCDDENGTKAIISEFIANCMISPEKTESIVYNILQATNDKIGATLMMAKANRLVKLKPDET